MSATQWITRSPHEGQSPGDGVVGEGAGPRPPKKGRGARARDPAWQRGGRGWSNCSMPCFSSLHRYRTSLPSLRRKKTRPSPPALTQVMVPAPYLPHVLCTHTGSLRALRNDTFPHLRAPPSPPCGHCHLESELQHDEKYIFVVYKLKHRL